MSKLGSLLLVASMMAAQAESHYTERTSVKQREPIPEWQRKKCKSCTNCGSVCNGKWSKPTHNACRIYSKKK